MKKDELRNSEFEKLLKNKLDELASSVDCFDKISDKAFPNEKIGFDDSEYTVSDLENITGKSKKHRFAPYAALAACAALCIGLLTNNGLGHSFFSKLPGSDNSSYRELISEINEEAQSGEYIWFDCTLEDYINNSILFTPLHSCPFEEPQKDDINVRIFIKTFGCLATNQIYAVQFEGEFSDANYIAAAESKAKFTREELESECSDIMLPYTQSYVLELIEKSGARGDISLPSDEISSFSYGCIYKYGDTIYPLNNEIVTYTNDTAEAFNYDYISMYINSSGDIEAFDTAAFDDAWGNVVYFNESSAKSDSGSSYCKKTDITSKTELKGESEYTINYYDISYESESENIGEVNIGGTEFSKIFEMRPVNPLIGNTIRVYTYAYPSEKDITYETAESDSSYQKTLFISEGTPGEEILLAGSKINYTCNSGGSNITWDIASDVLSTLEADLATTEEKLNLAETEIQNCYDLREEMIDDDEDTSEIEARINDYLIQIEHLSGEIEMLNDKIAVMQGVDEEIE